MGMPSGMELFAIVAVVVLLFGGKKIPELAKGIGQGIKNFKGAVKEDEPTTMATNDKKIDEEKQAQATQSNSVADGKPTTQADTKTTTV